MNRKAKVAMSRDHAIVLQPGEQEQNSISKERERKGEKEKRKEGRSMFCLWESGL